MGSTEPESQGVQERAGSHFAIPGEVNMGGIGHKNISNHEEITRNVDRDSGLAYHVHAMSGMAVDRVSDGQMVGESLNADPMVLKIDAKVQSGQSVLNSKARPVPVCFSEENPPSGSFATRGEVFIVGQNGVQDLDPAEVKRRAETLAAKRSLETNFIVILVFIAASVVLLIPSKMWQTYFCVVHTSVQKTLLPILSTMANFGTIRSVGKQLWESVFKTRNENED